MAVENLILLGIVLFLVFVLYKTLGNQQKMSEKQSKQQPKLPPKLKVLIGKTNSNFEIKSGEMFFDAENLEKAHNEAFAVLAQIAFQAISQAFKEGNLAELKNYLSETVYAVFEEQIKKRLENKQTLDFSIVCFDSVKITHKSPKFDKFTVQFITEQINVLKDEKGQAIEGDPMTIAKVKDVWTFKQLKNGLILCATQSEVV